MQQLKECVYDQNSNINLEGLLKQCSQGSCGNKAAPCYWKPISHITQSSHLAGFWNVTRWHSILMVSLGKHFFDETISGVLKNWNNTKENKNENGRLIHLWAVVPSLRWIDLISHNDGFGVCSVEFPHC